MISLYPWLRPALFLLDAERAHTLTLNSLKLTAQLGLLRQTTLSLPVRVMGIDFPNPIGLSAGLDKNGHYTDALSKLGFGFIEVGTITPRPQAGNDKPRLFRLTQQQALFNRMGFNNIGASQFVAQLQHQPFNGVLGVNIGKNWDTPLERAPADYCQVLEQVYPHAHYVTANISSPNTTGLRQLQQGDLLGTLIDALLETRKKLADTHQKYVPLVVKISPDMSADQLAQLAHTLLQKKVDGIIATNTTCDPQLMPRGHEMGGVSGAPLRERANDTLLQLAKVIDRAIPIIASGGIMSAQDVGDKLAAGAQLIQLYSGLIYRGPRLIGESVRAAHQSAAAK